MGFLDKIEAKWTAMAEKYVVLPGVTPEHAEMIGSLLADAFQPIFPWERGEDRRKTLASRAYARRRLRELIEEKFPDSLP